MSLSITAELIDCCQKLHVIESVENFVPETIV